jgi:hypothetical protein
VLFAPDFFTHHKESLENRASFNQHTGEIKKFLNAPSHLKFDLLVRDATMIAALQTVLTYNKNGVKRVAKDDEGRVIAIIRSMMSSYYREKNSSDSACVLTERQKSKRRPLDKTSVSDVKGRTSIVQRSFDAGIAFFVSDSSQAQSPLPAPAVQSYPSKKIAIIQPFQKKSGRLIFKFTLYASP